MSVLGTVTPLGERSRNGGFRRTALLYTASSTAAAAGLGALLALVARGVSRLPALHVPALAFAAAVGAAALAIDVSNRADRLPHMRRQVSDAWLGKFRPTIYAIGFGGQLGVAFTTHLVSAAAYAGFVFAALTKAPAAGALVGASFGLTRGLLVYLGARATDPVELAQLHRRVLGGERRVRSTLRALEAALAFTAILAAAGQL
jgi:hypothetical protein